MSSKVTIRQSKGVGVVGLLMLIAGVVLLLSGAITWWAVADKLADEDITVSEDASFLAGKKVNDPFSAFAQADVINRHALDASDGKTYAQLGQNDDRRDTVMNASFLRASLFTSVVSFGIAVLVMGLGVLFIVNGWALRRLAGGPPVVVETSNDRDGGSARDDRPSADSRSESARPAESSKEPGARRAAPVASSVTTPGARSSDAARPRTSSTPVVPAPETTDAPSGAPASSTAPAPATTTVEPVRVSRSERGSSSPSPAGLRPAAPPTGATPVVEQTPVSDAPSDTAKDTTKDAKDSGSSPAPSPDPDARPGGWASPADRVPPPDEKRRPSKD